MPGTSHYVTAKSLNLEWSGTYSSICIRCTRADNSVFFAVQMKNDVTCHILLHLSTRPILTVRYSECHAYGCHRIVNECRSEIVSLFADQCMFQDFEFRGGVSIDSLGSTSVR